MKKTYICDCCGGKELNFDSSGRWNEKNQQFDFTLEPFHYDEESIAFCVVCDNWTDFKEIELE